MFFGDRGGYIIDIYTIQNGVAVQQDIPDTSWLQKNGTVTVPYDVEAGSPYRRYYRFEDGVLKHQVTIDYDTFLDANGKETLITYEECERLQKEYEGDGGYAKLKWKPLWAYIG